ncbi:hypothetical protein JCM24511_02021 [Saitozyma sp. JCM 24511]|nr:hypothetical protein JCM24511_02021 [Saitozyma sp. JCM 24511]
MKPRSFKGALEMAQRLQPFQDRVRPSRSYPTLTALHLPVLHSTRRVFVPSRPTSANPRSAVGTPENAPKNVRHDSVPSSQENIVGFRSLYRQWSHRPWFHAALTALVGLGIAFGAGVGYLQWYKGHILRRIERAFDPGYDPALELSTINAPPSACIGRHEQPLIDSIFRGEHPGGYYLIVGPQGTGKGTMILETGGPALDVERAMNKLQKVALRYTKKHGRPLVIVFNSKLRPRKALRQRQLKSVDVHLFTNTPEGHALLHQLQQRAETWAQRGIVTMIFSADDFWCLDVLRKNASRMRVISTKDLSAAQSLQTLWHLRQQNLTKLHPSTHCDDLQVEDTGILRRCYELVGGRPSYLAIVASAPDMLDEAERMVETEKAWLLSKSVAPCMVVLSDQPFRIGLIPAHDDAVMEEQNCSWFLLRYLAREASTRSSVHLAGEGGQHEDVEGLVIRAEEDIIVPKVSYDEARRILTRADFIDLLNHLHAQYCIRLHSVLLLRAVQRVVEEKGFDVMLDQTRDRINEIEGLHRQSESTVKGFPGELKGFPGELR